MKNKITSNLKLQSYQKIPKTPFPINEILKIGNLKLNMKIFPSENENIANLLYVPGYGENCEMNAHVFQQLAKSNISTYAVDRRGFGSNSNLPGHIKGQISNQTGLVTDVLAQIEHIRSLLPNKPLYLYGYSLGGLINNYLMYANKISSREIQGLISYAPAFQFNPHFTNEEIDQLRFHVENGNPTK